MSEAVKQGHLDIMKLLVAKGADVNAQEIFWDTTPLYIAAHKGNKQVVQFLIDNGAKADPKRKFSMLLYYREAFEGYKRWAELLVAQGADITIHIAVLLGELEKVKSLVKRGANLNTADGYEVTPLHIASICGFTEIAKFLVKKDASVHTRTIFEETPLHYAASGGHKEIVELLLAKGADINAEKSNGRIPLNMARGSKEIVELLIKHGSRQQ